MAGNNRSKPTASAGLSGKAKMSGGGQPPFSKGSGKKGSGGEPDLDDSTAKGKMNGPRKR